MNENELRELFREMRDEPVPADSLARVRAGVAERIGKRRRFTAWKIAAALGMAGFMVAGWMTFRPAKTVRQVKAPMEIANVLPPEAAPLRPEPPVLRAARPRRARPRTDVKGIPVSIRIETPDPDVVILLVN